MAIKDLVNWNRRDNSLQKSDISNPFDLFQREMNRMFDSFFGDSGFFSTDLFKGDRFSSFAPKVNISEDEKSIEVTAELPGMKEKDIDVVLKDNVLTIKGERKNEHEEKKKNYHRVESSYGSFQRSVQLPDEVDADKVKASFRDGVLTVDMPKSEKAKENVRQIEVKSA